MNLGDGGCSEPRLRHCTPAWVTELDSVSKRKKKKQKTKRLSFLPSFSDMKLKLETVSVYLIFGSYEGAFCVCTLLNLVFLRGGQLVEASIHPSSSASNLIGAFRLVAFKGIIGMLE